MASHEAKDDGHVANDNLVPDTHDIEDVDMAAAMGFSSFGSQSRPSKKRRTNADNAVVDSQSVPGVPAMSASGANRAPINRRAQSAPDQSQGADLPMRPGSHPTEGSNPTETTRTGSTTLIGSGPLTNPTSSEHDSEEQPPEITHDRMQQLQYAGMSPSSLLSSDPLPTSVFDFKAHDASVSGMMAFVNKQVKTGPGDYQVPGAPEAPPMAFRMSAERIRPPPDAIRQGRQWWPDYYDPSSNQNPWEAVESPKALEPRGRFLPRGNSRGNRGGSFGGNAHGHSRG